MGPAASCGKRETRGTGGGGSGSPLAWAGEPGPSPAAEPLQLCGLDFRGSRRDGEQLPDLRHPELGPPTAWTGAGCWPSATHLSHQHCLLGSLSFSKTYQHGAVPLKSVSSFLDFLPLCVLLQPYARVSQQPQPPASQAFWSPRLQGAPHRLLLSSQGSGRPHTPFCALGTEETEGPLPPGTGQPGACAFPSRPAPGSGHWDATLECTARPKASPDAALQGPQLMAVWATEPCAPPNRYCHGFPAPRGPPYRSPGRSLSPGAPSECRSPPHAGTPFLGLLPLYVGSGCTIWRKPFSCCRCWLGLPHPDERGVMPSVSLLAPMKLLSGAPSLHPRVEPSTIPTWPVFLSVWGLSPLWPLLP